MISLEKEYLEIIEKIYFESEKLGGRLVGTPGDRWIEDYLVEYLETIGLEPYKQRYKTKTWIPHSWMLEVKQEGKWEEIPSYYMARTRPGTIEGRLKLVKDAHSTEIGEVEGDIVVGLLEFPSLDLTLLESVALYKSDPLQQIRPKGEKPSVFMTRLQPSECGCPVDPESYEAASAKNAGGYIGVLLNYPDMNCGSFTYYAPSDGLFRPLPGLWIPSTERKKIEEYAERKARARLSLEAEIKEVEGRNIYTIIPGKSEETIIVHSHHDAPYGGAVQDASGVAMVSLLAKHYARKQEKGWTPRKTLVFLYTEGHFDAGSGQLAFLEHFRDLKEKIIVDIAIEHIGKECIVENGYAVPTGDPEPRGIFISEDKQELVRTFVEAMEIAQPHSTLLLPTRTPLGVPSDANKFWREGVPVASLISGPIYMFSKCDTPDKVYTSDIDNLFKMYVHVIDKLSA